MPNQDWWLIFKTKKEGDAPKQLAGELKEVKKGLIGAVEGLTGMSIAGLGMAGVIAGVGKTMKESLDDTIDYAEQVRDLGRISGTTAEDTSRLIQAADDMKVSYETLTMAAKTASQKGIALSIDSIAKLSDEYLKIKDPADRAAFAMDNFGQRAGLEMTKMLEQGSTAIRAMGEAQADNLILTQRQIDAARDWEKNTDALSDAWMGVKYTIGNAVIPVLNDLFKATTKQVDIQSIITEKLSKMSQAEADQAIFAEKYTGALRKEAEAQLAMSEAFATNLQQLQDAPPRTDEYTGSIEALAEKTGTASDAMKTFSTQLLYNKAAANLDDDAALSLAYSMGLVDEKTVYVTGRIADLAQQLKDKKISVEEYTREVKRLNDEMSGIKDRSATITIHNVTTRVTNDDGVRRFGGEAYASGGSFRIPDSYGYEGYPLGPGKTASGGETVTVTPKGKGGGGVTIQNVIINNGMDQATFERMLMRATGR